jgi:hypothetical protein
MPARKSTTGRKSPARFEGDPTTQFSAIVWLGADAGTMQKFWFDSPVEALATCVEYLKRGYQTRLSDGAVRHFAELERAPVGPVVPPAKFAGEP